MAIRAGVIGAGAWGTALAHVLATKGDDVTIWAFEPEVVAEINEAHENKTFLPGIELPKNFRATGSLAEAVDGAELILTVCPRHVVRKVVGDLAPHLPEGVPIVSASKGIENETLMTMSEVLEDVLPMAYHPMLAYLSGPSFAREVGLLQPTLVSVAGRFERVAEKVQGMMASPYFRVYSSTDVPGVEFGGALKNVIAIAAGAASGLGLGTNARAALITRGLAEITRLAVKRGANPLTLAGLSGMGDLVLTCTGQLSRNRTVGEKLGQGQKLADIVSDMKQVAEGVKTAKSAHNLAKREEVDMPITSMVYRMLYEDLPVHEAVVGLMSRRLKREGY
ncbi:MAG: NAD(P)-dependent glycerol-3-phosphate dehydrogenase [Deltaproteobacteria bacterium]|jgi:glycerol-3-phosphate dehydrogenase (NAD(P)+)|nr:NAD(P)-dependent glycerol-3-phosphate dehydrogenase [Deltaproteobacteria bacterium]MBW2537152.1 NAD(P)-dependent glycerol-3-phosphate dehydrogenase [Deltaproteobacteria bacterium]